MPGYTCPSLPFSLSRYLTPTCPSLSLSTCLTTCSPPVSVYLSLSFCHSTCVHLSLALSLSLYLLVNCLSSRINSDISNIELRFNHFYVCILLFLNLRCNIDKETYFPSLRHFKHFIIHLNWYNLVVQINYLRPNDICSYDKIYTYNIKLYYSTL